MNSSPEDANNDDPEVHHEPSSRNWFHRSFGRMEEGSVRGNMFLLIVTTIGSAFFVLPHCARQIGLFFAALLVICSALLSLFCSQILFIGFKETKANTYNECMEGLLGKKIGLMSTVVIMMHTFGSSISTWIFSWIYLSSGVLQLLKIDPATHPVSILYQHAYFFLGFLVIFTVTLFRSIEKLKLVSIVGFGMILFLVAVFVSLMPSYFEHFNGLGYIKFISFKWDLYALKAWGITNYMFLNQYAITPICKTTKNVNFRRVTKIIGRTIGVVCLVYVLILFCGYFSLPTNAFNEIFLLRPAINGESDVLIMTGKICFGSALFVGVMVRSHFVLIYLDQFIGKVKEVLGSNGGKGDAYINIASGDTGETASMYPKSSLVVWKPAASIRNFVFLLTVATFATLGVNYLLKILGFLGSFVGVFELIIIPVSMFLVIDRRRGLMSQPTRVAFVFFSILLTIISFCAVITNFIL